MRWAGAGRNRSLTAISGVVLIAECDSVRCVGALRRVECALGALAVATQVIPRVDAAGVSVEPVELEGVAAHGLSTRWPCRTGVTAHQKRECSCLVAHCCRHRTLWSGARA